MPVAELENIGLALRYEHLKIVQKGRFSVISKLQIGTAGAGGGRGLKIYTETHF